MDVERQRDTYKKALDNMTNDAVKLQDRIEQLEAALRRQGDNMALILNHATLPEGWYAKFTHELEADRQALESKS